MSSQPKSTRGSTSEQREQAGGSRPNSGPAKAVASKSTTAKPSAKKKPAEDDDSESVSTDRSAKDPKKRRPSRKDSDSTTTSSSSRAQSLKGSGRATASDDGRASCTAAQESLIKRSKGKDRALPERRHSEPHKWGPLPGSLGRMLKATGEGDKGWLSQKIAHPIRGSKKAKIGISEDVSSCFKGGTIANGNGTDIILSSSGLPTEIVQEIYSYFLNHKVVKYDPRDPPPGNRRRLDHCEGDKHTDPAHSYDYAKYAGRAHSYDFDLNLFKLNEATAEDARTYFNDLNKLILISFRGRDIKKYVHHFSVPIVTDSLELIKDFSRHVRLVAHLDIGWPYPPAVTYDDGRPYSDDELNDQDYEEGQFLMVSVDFEKLCFMMKFICNYCLPPAVYVQSRRGKTLDCHASTIDITPRLRLDLLHLDLLQHSQRRDFFEQLKEIIGGGHGLIVTIKVKSDTKTADNSGSKIADRGVSKFANESTSKVAGKSVIQGLDRIVPKAANKSVSKSADSNVSKSASSSGAIAEELQRKMAPHLIWKHALIMERVEVAKRMRADVLGSNDDNVEDLAERYHTFFEYYVLRTDLQRDFLFSNPNKIPAIQIATVKAQSLYFYTLMEYIALLLRVRFWGEERSLELARVFLDSKLETLLYHDAPQVMQLQLRHVRLLVCLAENAEKRVREVEATLKRLTQDMYAFGNHYPKAEHDLKVITPFLDETNAHRNNPSVETVLEQMSLFTSGFWGWELHDIWDDQPVEWTNDWRDPIAYAQLTTADQKAICKMQRDHGIPSTEFGKK